MRVSFEVLFTNCGGLAADPQRSVFTRDLEAKLIISFNAT